MRRAFRVPGSVDRDITEEIRFHLESRTADLIAQGLGADAARRQAESEFGDVTESRTELASVDEQHRHRRHRRDLASELRQDLRQSLRAWRRQPGVTAVVLLSLAIGIGVTTAIVTIANAVLLRPLPYRAPEQLVHLWETRNGDATDRSEASFPDFTDWRAQNTAFTALEGYSPTNVTVLSGDTPLMVRGASITPGFLAMLGVAPIRGRAFTAQDAAPGAPAVALVSEAFLEEQTGGNGAPLGKPLSIDGQTYQVVGVLPRSFHFAPLQDAVVWLNLPPEARRMQERFNHWLNVVGRVKPGVSIENASADLTTVMRRLAEQFPESNRGRAVAVVPLRDIFVGAVRPVLLVLVGMAVLVLLIACVNVASLLLARAVARSPEIALRATLGASRARLRQQLLTESVVLTASGGIAGLLVGEALLKILLGALPADVLTALPTLQATAINPMTFAFSGIIAVTIGMTFGLAPARFATRQSLSQSIRAGGRGMFGGPGVGTRRALVAAQFALTVVLLVGTGLMVKSLTSLLHENPGFDAEHVVTARIPLQGERYRADAAQRQFFEQLLAKVRAIPGVRDVGAVTQAPLQGGGTNTFRVEGEPEPDAAHRPEAVMRGVAGDYFRTMSIQVSAGRTLTARDDSAATQAIVVSAKLAHQLFRDRSPLGARVRFYAFPERTWTIVGVAGDVKTAALDTPAPPTIYYSHLQAAENRMSLMVRTTIDPATLVASIRRTVHELDSGIPVYNVATMKEIITRSPAVFMRKYPLVLIGVFASTALLLATIGIYGVMSYDVVRRRRELAVRIALGAQPHDILAMVVWKGAMIAAAGIAFGLVAVAGLSRFLAALLYGVPGIDPSTYATVAAALFAIALLATLVPARSAAQVDPQIALRAV